MSAPTWPYEFGHHQFDTETADQWSQFLEDNPYVEDRGRRWTQTQLATT